MRICRVTRLSSTSELPSRRSNALCRCSISALSRRPEHSSAAPIRSISESHDGDLNFREIPIEVEAEDFRYAAKGFDLGPSPKTAIRKYRSTAFANTPGMA